MAEKLKPDNGEQPDSAARLGELSLISGAGDNDSQELWLLPPALTDEGEIAIVLAETATSIKKSYQELLGISDRNKLENKTDELRYRAVKKIFTSLKMLPDEPSDEEEKSFKSHYEATVVTLPGLSSTRRGELLDAYEDTPAAKAVFMLGRVGINDERTPSLKRDETTPILITILALMDAEQLES